MRYPNPMVKLQGSIRSLVYGMPTVLWRMDVAPIAIVRAKMHSYVAVRNSNKPRCDANLAQEVTDSQCPLLVCRFCLRNSCPWRICCRMPSGRTCAATNPTRTHWHHRSSHCTIFCSRIRPRHARGVGRNITLFWSSPLVPLDPAKSVHRLTYSFHTTWRLHDGIWLRLEQTIQIGSHSWQWPVIKLTQSVHLSQRDRAMLRVIEYFTKSLKVSQGHSKRHHWVGRASPY